MGKSRIEFSNKSADQAYDVLKQWGNPFDERDLLINICSRKEATPTIRDDIKNTLKIGENALGTIWKDRLKSKNGFLCTNQKAKFEVLQSFENHQIKR